jgi:hypothetical protein
MFGDHHVLFGINGVKRENSSAFVGTTMAPAAVILQNCWPSCINSSFPVFFRLYPVILESCRRDIRSK